MRLGDLIKKSRQAKKINQTKLGEMLGYSSGQFISNWERGVSTPPLDQVEKLCLLLNIEKKVYKKILIQDFKDKVERYV